MSSWTPGQLAALGGADEVEVASYRDDGSLRSFVTIWAVRSGEFIFVRSAYPARGGWYRHALASGTGRIRAAGIEQEVTFERVLSGHDAIDAAYHEKYDRYGARIVGAVVSPESHEATLKLAPR